MASPVPCPCPAPVLTDLMKFCSPATKERPETSERKQLSAFRAQSQASFCQHLPETMANFMNSYIMKARNLHILLSLPTPNLLDCCFSGGLNQNYVSLSYTNEQPIWALKIYFVK